MGTTYTRRSGVREQKVGNELMLIDEETDKVHILNATSAFVWNCLDGTSDEEHIAARLGAAFDTQGRDVRAVVRKALEQLSDKGLVGRGAAQRSAPP